VIEVLIFLFACYWLFRAVTAFVRYADRVLATLEKQEDE